jgi:hypothetical protein
MLCIQVAARPAVEKCDGVSAEETELSTVNRTIRLGNTIMLVGTGMY